jgi:aryl-alcohol dehydrogenase
VALLVVNSRQAVDVLGILGVCGLIGVVPPETPVTLNMKHIMNGRRIMGIIEGDAIRDLFVPKLVELYQQKRFPFDRPIKIYAFEEINQAVSDMMEGRVIKPVSKL